MVNKVVGIRELNELQLNDKYVLEREMEIEKQMDELRESSWSQEEKNKIKGYHTDMNNFNNKFTEKIYGLF